jgi:hypothetical protein
MDSGDEPASSQSIEEEIIQHELSDSDSASCNSIRNPFYDGPQTEAASAPQRRTEAGTHLPSPGPSTPDATASQTPIKNNEMVVITFAPGYFRTCIGFLRLLQFVSLFCTNRIWYSFKM